MKPTWQSECGSVQLYLGDCMDVLRELTDGSVDAVVTDPPYGIGEARGKNKSRGKLAVSKDYGFSRWDDKTNETAIQAARDISQTQIVFGGNYYNLPPSSCWLVWDKLNGKSDFADCELAWTNLKRAVRRLQFRWNGMLRDGNDGERVHPTQKPIDVMAWCIKHLPDDAETILDPFMGSGTTGVAAVRMGRKFIGCEIEPKYFEIAKQRIQDELNRYPLFEEEVKETQAELFA